MPVWSGSLPTPRILTRQDRLIARLVKDTHRASHIIAQVRALTKGSNPEKGPLNINETILATVTLIDGEIQRSQVSLQTQLSSDVPIVDGDRVQLTTSNPESDPQRDRSHEPRCHGTEKPYHKFGEERFKWRSDISSGLGRRVCAGRIATVSSMPSIRPSPAAWAWGSRLVARLSRTTAAAYGRHQIRRVVPSFNSLCQSAGS